MCPDDHTQARRKAAMDPLIVAAKEEQNPSVVQAIHELKKHRLKHRHSSHPGVAPPLHLYSSGVPPLH